MLWIQRDPLGRIPGANEYAYCLGESVDLFDPMGLYGWGDYWHDFAEGAREFRDQFTGKAAQEDAHWEQEAQNTARRQWSKAMQQKNSCQAQEILTLSQDDIFRVQRANKDRRRKFLELYVSVATVVVMPAAEIATGGIKAAVAAARAQLALAEAAGAIEADAAAAAAESVAAETAAAEATAEESALVEANAAESAASEAAQSAPRNPDAYQNYFEAPIEGTTRAAHRNGANRYLAETLESDPELAQAFDRAFGRNVLDHMQSGASNLRNPPGAVWHHPPDNPDILQLLLRPEHSSPELQPLLHPNGIGGFGMYYAP